MRTFRISARLGRSRVAATAAAAAVAMLLVPAPAEAAGQAPPVLEGFEVVAHRGSTNADITENTLPAFDRAMTHGADAIELDVRLTADRGLVVMHDGSLDRTTTCTGLVRQRTLSWIRQQCLGERGGERIPSLAIALSWAASRDVRLLLDLKMTAAAWRAEDYAQLTRLVDARGVGSRAHYLSFLPEHLLGVRAAKRTARLHVIARSVDEVEGYRAWADAIHISTRAITSELLASLRADGIAVLGRNTNNPDHWAALRRLGVDGLLTDQLVAYNRWLARAS